MLSYKELIIYSNKHVFYVHSQITALIAHSIILHYKLEKKDICIFYARNFYYTFYTVKGDLIESKAIPSTFTEQFLHYCQFNNHNDVKTNAYNFWQNNVELQNIFKNSVKRFNNQDFNLYIPYFNCPFIFFALLPQCKTINYIEDGGLAYDPLISLKKYTNFIENTIDPNIYYIKNNDKFIFPPYKFYKKDKFFKKLIGKIKWQFQKIKDKRLSKDIDLIPYSLLLIIMYSHIHRLHIFVSNINAYHRVYKNKSIIDLPHIINEYMLPHSLFTKNSMGGVDLQK